MIAERDRFRVLHVDDDSIFLNVSNKIISLKGNFEVISATSVDEALSKIAHESFDAIISDYEMPLKDGLEFLKTIRDMKIGISFILFTGKGREEVVVKALNLGADGYIDKHGDIETVYTELIHNTVSSILRRKAEKDLIENENRYHSLFINLNEGYAYCKVLYNEQNKANDFIFLEVNNAFEKLTGLTKDRIISQKITDIFSRVKEHQSDLETCIKVATTGQSASFELHIDRLKMWFSISSFSPKKDFFILILENITKHKKAEAIANARSDVLQFAIKHTSQELFRYVINRTEQLTNSKIGYFHLIGADEATISLQAWSDETLAHYCSIDNPQRHYPLNNAGIWADCIRQRKPIMCNDYNSYPHNTLPQGHAAIKRFISIPIFRNGLIIAIIGVGNRLYDYDEEDVQTVSQLADLTWEIYERKRLEEVSHEQEAIITAMHESSNGPMFMVDTNYNYVQFNHQHKEVMQALFGVEIEPGKSILSYITKAEDQKIAKTNIDRALSGEIVEDSKYTGDEKYSSKYFLVRHYPVKNVTGKILGVSVLATDLTNLKRTDDKLSSINELLTIINDSEKTEALIKNTFKFFRKISGCEAVGIRLKKDSDYPYYVSEGFDKEHLLLENSLCTRDINKQIVCDSSGNPILDCMCGNIICSRFDPTKPFFTKGGSFWTNSTTHLLSTTSESDRQARTRNRCNGEGYESVALLPLVFGNQKLGLIQLNDKRKNMFTAEKIQLFEQLACYLSIALSRHLAEEQTIEVIAQQKGLRAKLEEADERYNILVENISDGLLLADLQGNHLYHNSAYSSGLGYNPEEHLFSRFDEIVHPDDLPTVKLKMEEVLKTGCSEVTYRIRNKGGFWVQRHANVSLVQDNNKTPVAVLLVIHDETKRAQEAEHLKLLNEKLKIIGSLTRHDIRNRLSAINTVAFILNASNPDNSEIKDLSKDLTESVQAMNHLLDFSAVYEKIGSETMGQIDVGKSFSEALKLFSNTADLQIVNDCIGLMVTADSLLRQLFYNLIDNSLKHGKSLSKITLKHQQQDNKIIISYEDDGQGISEENKPKLFTFGFTTGGTGHGLYLIKKICTTYGWQVTENGVYGRGARFCFDIDNLNKN